MRGSARAPACAHGACTCAHRAKAQMRHPDTLKRRIFLKCEYNLGRAWTDPEGHGRAAGACSCPVLRAKLSPGVGGGEGGLPLCTPSVSFKKPLDLRVLAEKKVEELHPVRHPGYRKGSEAHLQRGRPSFGYCCYPLRQQICKCSKSNTTLKKK